MINYVTGDATQPQDPDPKVIVHICNDVGGWGKGFVLALSKRWPQPEAAYRDWFKSQEGFALGEVQFVEVEDGEVWVANVIAQHDIKAQNGVAPIRYQALAKALERVADFCHNHGATAHMPRLGCGLAGGTWDKVEACIMQGLIANFVRVTVYDFPQEN